MDENYSHINSFLDKFRRIFSDKKEIKNLILEIIYKNTNIKLEEDDISIKTPFITIKKSPIIRNEILTKKEKILSDLRDKKLNTNFVDFK